MIMRSMVTISSADSQLDDTNIFVNVCDIE